MSFANRFFLLNCSAPLLIRKNLPILSQILYLSLLSVFTLPWELFFPYFRVLDLLFSYLIFNVHCLSAWWAQVDSNHRPCAYQAHALTTWAMSPYTLCPPRLTFVSLSVLSYFSCFTSRSTTFPESLLSPFGWWRWRGSNPWTPCLQSRCSPNWATPPWSPSSSSQKPWKLNNEFSSLPLRRLYDFTFFDSFWNLCGFCLSTYFRSVVIFLTKFEISS